MPTKQPALPLTPDQELALRLLAQADAIEKKDPEYLPVVAVGRLMKSKNVHALSQPISHRGGLIGFAALCVDGEYFDRHGNRGLKEIGRARFREYGYKGRWKLLGPGQPIDLSPRATYGQGDVREIARRIKGIENVLRVELDAKALTESTPMPAAVPSPRRPRF